MLVIKVVGVALMSRNHFTPAFARSLSNEKLIEFYENASKVRRGAPDTMPATRMRAEKRCRIARSELLKRGFSRDEVDYEPESVPSPSPDSMSL